MRAYTLGEIAYDAKDANGYIDNIYLHWTAGRYGQFFDDYHVLIDADGTIHMPADNLRIKRNHTWRRNSRSVGIALCCGYGAVANAGYNCQFGDYPPTKAQIEAMAQVVATICQNANVSIADVLTHCEAAYRDGYGPYSGDPETRWDLWYLPDSAYDGRMRGGGEVIRGKALWYITQS